MRSGIIVWMIAAVFGLFVFLGSVTATCDSRLGNIVKKNIEVSVLLAGNAVNYVKIEVSEVPNVVRTAVAAKYSAYVIDEAFKGDDDCYKLILKRNDKKITVYYNKTGEFQKEETDVSAQLV